MKHWSNQSVIIKLHRKFEIKAQHLNGKNSGKRKGTEWLTNRIWNYSFLSSSGFTSSELINKIIKVEKSRCNSLLKKMLHIIKKLTLRIINHNILYTHAMHYSFSKTFRLSIYHVKLPVKKHGFICTHNLSSTDNLLFFEL